MAELTIQTIANTGVVPTAAAAAGGGDSFANTGREFLLITNGGAGGITLTIVTQNTTFLNSLLGGLAVADRTVTVGIGETKLVGPFETNVYNDTSNLVQMTYSGVTSVTVSVFKLP